MNLYVVALKGPLWDRPKAITRAHASTVEALRAAGPVLAQLEASAEAQSRFLNWGVFAASDCTPLPA